eukprot:15140849-Ditylum_brightwellii.AAC.1
MIDAFFTDSRNELKELLIIHTPCERRSAEPFVTSKDAILVNYFHSGYEDATKPRLGLVSCCRCRGIRW